MTEESLDGPAAQRQYYADTADQYDEMHGADEGHLEALEDILTTLERMGGDRLSILDVGAGTGRVAKYFFDRGYAVHGIEPVEALVAAGMKDGVLPPGTIDIGDGGALPYADGTFDVVCAFAVLHHVPDSSIVVREMMRVARRAIFIADGNRFGQGPFLAGVVKRGLWMLGLWPLANRIKTRGKGYVVLSGDGIVYSYSVFDSKRLLEGWAGKDGVSIVATDRELRGSRPLFRAPSALLSAVRRASA